MNWLNLYSDRRGKWLRGNLHTHSGEGMTQAEIFKRYKALGYDFICISNHRKMTDLEHGQAGKLALIPGFEWNSKIGHHINLLSLAAPDVLRQCAKITELPGMLKRIKGKPVLMILNHPNRGRRAHYSMETLCELAEHALGMEIFNGEGEFSAGSAQATGAWDHLLSIGRHVLGFANDDAHRPLHVGLGWLMARSPSRSPRAIYNAIKKGNFYCSTGVTFSRIQRKGMSITIESPDAQEIRAIGDWGALLAKVHSNRMVFDFNQVCGVKYARFVAYGKGAAMAWTQPFLKMKPIAPNRFSPFLYEWQVARDVLPMPLSKVNASIAATSGLRWQSLKITPKSFEETDGFVDVHVLHGKNNGTALLRTEIEAPCSGKWIVAMGHDGGARLFLDGKKIIDVNKLLNPAYPERSRANAYLKKGRHSILAALDTANGLGQGIFLRFIVPNGVKPNPKAFPKIVKTI